MTKPGTWLEVRLLNRIEVGEDDECWPCSGSAHGAGYATINIGGKMRRVSHIILELDGRPRPSNKHKACHTCDNPPCANPKHLWWGTDKENAEDMVSKRRNLKTVRSARERMIEQRKDPEFAAKRIAAVRQYWRTKRASRIRHTTGAHNGHHSDRPVH